MINNNFTKIPENIIKNLFNKESKDASQKLDNFISSNIPLNNQKEYLTIITKEYTNDLFDPIKFKNEFNKGNLTPITEMIKILKNYNESEEMIFILIKSLFKIINNFEYKIIYDYIGKINNILKKENKMVLMYFDEIFDTILTLKKINTEDILIKSSISALDKTLKNNLSSYINEITSENNVNNKNDIIFINKDNKIILNNFENNNINNEIENKNKKNNLFNLKNLLVSMTINFSDKNIEIKKYLIDWIIFLLSLNFDILKFISEIIFYLFDMLNDNEISINCINEIKKNIDNNYIYYYVYNKEILKNLIIYIIGTCNHNVNIKIKNYALKWLEFILKKFKFFLNINNNNFSNKYIEKSLSTKTINNYNNNNQLNNNNKNSHYQNTLSANLTNNKTKNSSIQEPPPLYMNDNERKIYLLDKKEKKILINLIPYDIFPNILQVILIQKNYSVKNETFENINNYFIEVIKLSFKYTIHDNIKEIRNYTEIIRKTLELSKNDILNKKLILKWFQIIYNSYEVNNIDNKNINNEIFNDFNKFIKSYTKNLPDEEKELTEYIEYLINIIHKNENDLKLFLINFVEKCEDEKYENNFLKKFGIKIIKIIVSKVDIKIFFEILSNYLITLKNYQFIFEFVNILNLFLLSENYLDNNNQNNNSSIKEFKKILIYYSKVDLSEKDNIYLQIFRLFSYNPISLLIFTIYTEFYELSFNIILNLIYVELDKDYYKDLIKIIQLIETNSFNEIRMKLLNPLKNIYLVKTLYGILMLLPKGVAYNALSNRLKGLETLLEFEDESNDKDIINEENNSLVNKYIKIFLDVQNIIKNNII